MARQVMQISNEIPVDNPSFTRKGGTEQGTTKRGEKITQSWGNGKHKKES